MSQDDVGPTEGRIPPEEGEVEQRVQEEEGAAPGGGEGGLDDGSAQDVVAGEDTATEGESMGPEALDADAALSVLQADYEELNDRHLRLAAEFNNYRRRVEMERLDLWARAQAEFMGRLADVLDDLQRVAGLDLGSATVEGVMEGIDLVERKFVRAIEDAGAVAIDPEGEVFDPETMEAMMRVTADSESEDDTVAQVFQKGYTFKGHLVRAARVSVLKHS